MTQTHDIFDDPMNILVDKLRELQNNRCAICGREVRLIIDHDHHSGFVRGLLCGPCNGNEGRHEPGEWCRAVGPDQCAICEYLAAPPVSWIGYTVHYWKTSMDWWPERRSNHYAWEPSSLLTKRMWDGAAATMSAVSEAIHGDRR